MDNILINIKNKDTGGLSSLQSFSNTLIISDTPIGTIIQFAGSSDYVPNGWILCDGRSISKNIYVALFNVIGTTYGGDGSPNFNIPDLRSCFPVGYNSTGTFNQLNKKGGAETVTLTTSEIPSHEHYSFSNLTTPVIRALSIINPYPLYQMNLGNNQLNYNISGDATEANIGLTEPKGNGNAHNNLPPYIVLNYIIYVGV